MGQLVSVIVPMYQGAQWVEDAVRSVLAQTYDDLEVLVIDDGSTDGGASIVSRIADDRLRLIGQENQGVAAARNTGLSASTGEFVAFLDQDDVWFPTKIERQLPLFAEADVTAVGSLMMYLGPKGPMRAVGGEIANHQQERIAAARLMPFPPSSMVVRSSTIDAAGGFDAELARQAGPVDDIDFLSRIAQHGRVLTVPEPLGYYRVHAGAGSFKKFSEMQRATRFLQDRMVTGQTWEQWLEGYQPTIDERRLERARFQYRSAGLAIGSGRYVSGITTLAIAFLASPGYVVRRLRRQLAGHGRP